MLILDCIAINKSGYVKISYKYQHIRSLIVYRFSIPEFKGSKFLRNFLRKSINFLPTQSYTQGDSNPLRHGHDINIPCPLCLFSKSSAMSIQNKPLHFHIWSTLTKFLILTAKYIVYDKIARVNSSAVYSDVRTKVLKVM